MNLVLAFTIYIEFKFLDLCDFWYISLPDFAPTYTFCEFTWIFPVVLIGWGGGGGVTLTHTSSRYVPFTLRWVLISSVQHVKF